MGASGPGAASGSAAGTSNANTMNASPARPEIRTILLILADRINRRRRADIKGSSQLFGFQ
jgi:hypothetical protein